MNYQAHYDKLIARGKRTLIHGYRERHHIIPKCIGGDNSEENLVYLTAEEHFVAHKLLVKIYPGVKGLVFALFALTLGNSKVRRNNKLVGSLRAAYADACSGRKRNFSEQAKENIRISASKPKSEDHKKKLSEANKGKTLSEETKRKISLAGRGRKMTFKGRIAFNKGVPMSEEQKEKIRETKRQNPMRRASCIGCRQENTIIVLSRDHKECYVGTANVTKHLPAPTEAEAAE